MRYRFTMRGIISWGTYLPFRRLDRTTIASVAGSGGGKGTRTVASYDEDTTTLGVEAARVALRDCPDAHPLSLWFATTEPAYLDKTNATAIHAALRLDSGVPAYDALGSIRSTLGALRAALDSSSTSLVVTADRRGSLPGSPDESAGGDGASSVLIGDDASDAPVLAEIVAWESLTEEFLDRWRTPGDIRSRQWEERFGETRYTDLGARAIAALLSTTGLAVDAIDYLIVVGPHDRANSAVAKKSGVASDRVVDTFGANVGNTGAAAPLFVLASVLERALPGQRILLL
ncbi:MAG: hydroxymethylglutaryl-CoA synthase family protein, partial [Acidimicrobiia bacterium]|nr:hydroxymethylglutaryl-CoA synthase family protein [Acidimicrobiia bacterium]